MPKDMLFNISLAIDCKDIVSFGIDLRRGAGCWGWGDVSLRPDVHNLLTICLRCEDKHFPPNYPNRIVLLGIN